ncbi:MAG: hypothetical protein IPM55_04095 [Acidobacteria bacterium]|nr:hypothetical protein [Acidobacteriota bacterium]
MPSKSHVIDDSLPPVALFVAGSLPSTGHLGLLDGNSRTATTETTAGLSPATGGVPFRSRRASNTLASSPQSLKLRTCKILSFNYQSARPAVSAEDALIQLQQKTVPKTKTPTGFPFGYRPGFFFPGFRDFYDVS